jgi:hypothetical protein
MPLGGLPGALSQAVIQLNVAGLQQAVTQLGAADRLQRSIQNLGSMGQIERAINQLDAVTRLQNVLGSGANQAAGLQTLGTALGFAPGSLAASAYEATLSGIGAGRAAQAGLAPEYNIAYPVNYGERTVRLLEEMIRIFRRSGRDEALLFARQTGIDAAFQINYMSSYLQNRLLRQSLAGPSDFEKRASAEFHGASDLARMTMQRWTQQIASPFMFGAAAFLKALSYVFRPFGTQDKHSSMDANTQAIKENTMAIRNQTEGIFGGGIRARTAIPGAMGFGNGFWLQKNYRFLYGRLGTFAVGH